MKKISLGRYVPYNTVVHKLNPCVKLFMLIALMVAVFMKIKLWGFAVLIVFQLLTMLISKVSIRSFFRSLKAMWFMLLLLTIFNVIFIKTGTVLVNWGKFRIYDQAIYQSLYIIFRLGLMMGFTMIFTSTTKPLEITYAIEFFLTPISFIFKCIRAFFVFFINIFKKNKIPYKGTGNIAHEIAMIISIALRFIPTLLDETNRLMSAQASRGVDYENGTIKEKVTAVVSLIIPLFVSSFQRSDDLAAAMVVRGYNPDAKRTRYKKYSVAFKDFLSLAVVAGIFVTAILIKGWIKL